MKSENGIIAICAAIMANVLWGSTFMASKVVLAQCPPVTAVLVRFLIALVVFALVAIVRRNNFQLNVLKARFGSMLGLGSLGYTALYILQMTALKHIASSQSAAIMLLAPVFALVSESFLRKELRTRDAIVTAIGFAGAAAILVEQYRVDFSGVAFQGLLLTIGASLCLGISVIQTKRLLAPIGDKPAFTVFNLTFFSLIIGAVGLIPFVAVEQIGVGGRLPMTADFWLWSSYLGIFCSVGELLYGRQYGNVSALTRQAVSDVVADPKIKNVITYYDIGGYELRLAGKYRNRLYTDARFIGHSDLPSNYSGDRGPFLIVDFPEINKESAYWRFFNTCRTVRTWQDKLIKAYVFDCQKGDLTLFEL
jgi:drug/metabolite transporter (DMT)-like permease